MIPPVVDVAWWREHADDVVLVDVRWYLTGASGAEAYGSGHLPGAVFVDLDRWLAGPPGPDVGRHPLPNPAVFAEGMSRAGVGDGSTVVAYDDAGGAVAARLVWMLRATGHDAALLDGGIAAYDGPLSTDVPTPGRASFTPVPWPADLVATLDDVVTRAGVVLDARAPERYRGDVEPVDARPGHVPGARNVPFSGNLDDDGRFLPTAELRARFEAAGVTTADDVVVYCGSGVTACHDLLAMEHAGLGVGRLFAGSWSQYSHATHLPAATGDDAG